MRFPRTASNIEHGSAAFRNKSLHYSIVLMLAASAQADTLEQNLARGFVKGYKQNEARLVAIDEELHSLPQPYLREPTGTGGFLTHEQKSSTSEVVLAFSWEKPVELDAVALFPLRLFMDEVYGENLYWPESITIEAEIDGRQNLIAQGTGGQPLIRQSLPELIEFAPVSTRRLTIRCTDLPQHPHEKWHAAGFAEICIFSGANNVAPQASCKASHSRQGYHVLAQEFLTDAQTPLGLPELSSHSKTHPFIKKFGFGHKIVPGSYKLTCTYPREILIDAVRIDPAIEHSYGQSFPVRFTIDLLDAQGQVVQSDTTYETFPMRKPGLNPHFSRFPETKAQAVRLTVYEASQPIPEAAPAIAFSEISAQHKGVESERATLFEERYRGKTIRLVTEDPTDTKAKLALSPANDGLTHSGQVLPLRQWIEGLVRRQQLMEEQMILRQQQGKTVSDIAKTLIYGSLTLLLLVIGSAAFLIVRNRIRMRGEIRSTRARIASDLHDDVGSNLGTIILHVEKLEEQINTAPERKRLKAIYRLTRESVFGLREVLSTTAPEVGRTQNLVAYMDELAGLVLGKTDYTFASGPAIGEALLEQTLRKGILLFYKEALYNAKRHSACSQVEISIRLRDGNIILRIKDNGKGIDQDALKQPRTLRTLKQRADWLHAHLEIESAPGAGTQLILSIPQE
ncbi:Sensor histidine kinase LiaS [Pontiella desulfatans]|uniref:Sensor histidine kinase LiaS n=1 Tax=Pontiella desulfatans TaxID=2750659 RepID=A0A6C2U1H0_PONDE|nr:ATP-binding protein [Pontiella desulfatans]VGO13226.1 Sensor histidine kinase LiaS [Pontiella desulfatans]